MGITEWHSNFLHGQREQGALQTFLVLARDSALKGVVFGNLFLKQWSDREVAYVLTTLTSAGRFWFLFFYSTDSRFGYPVI